MSAAIVEEGQAAPVRGTGRSTAETCVAIADGGFAEELRDLEELLRAEMPLAREDVETVAGDDEANVVWIRERRRLRQAIRDLPRSLRPLLRRVRDVALALRLAEVLREAIIRRALRCDGLYPNDAAATPRRRRYTTVVRLGLGRSRVELTAEGRRKLYRDIDGSHAWRQGVRHLLERTLAGVHLVATSEEGNDGVVEHAAKRPTAARSGRNIEAASYPHTRLDDPPAGWVIDAIEQALGDRDHAEMGPATKAPVLLVGCSPGLHARLRHALPWVDLHDEPRAGQSYPLIVCNVLPPTSQAGANHHASAYHDEELPAARLGVHRWRERVRALLEVLPGLLLEGGEVRVLLPLGVRDARGYVEDLAMLDVLKTPNTGPAWGAPVEVVELEPAPWPFVGRARPRRVAVNCTFTGGTADPVNGSRAELAPTLKPRPAIVRPMSPQAPSRPQAYASSYERLLSDDLLARACSLSVVSRADARTVDALGERIADRIRTTSDLGEYIPTVRDLLRLEPQELRALIAREPLRLVRIPKTGGQGYRETLVPTLLRRLVGQAIRHTIEAHVEGRVPDCVRAYRPGAVDAVPRAILDAAAAVRGGRRYFAKLDFKDFFDRVPHRLVREALAHYGFDASFVAVVMAVLSGARVLERGRDGSFQAVERPAGRGIGQGLPEAPALANLIAHYLDAKLGSNPRLTYLRWSDDILIASGKHHEVVGAVRTIRRWCARWGLELKGVSPTASDRSLVNDIRRTRIPFLGAEIDGNGRVRMPAGKLEAQAEELHRKIGLLAVGDVRAVSTYAGGGTNAVDLDDIDAATDAYIAYWRALDPRDAHAAVQALKTIVAESPALRGGTSASVTWEAVLPATHDEGPETTRAPRAFSQRSSSEPGHRGPGPGAPTAPTGMGLRPGRVREGGPVSHRASVEVFHRGRLGQPVGGTESIRGVERQGFSPDTPKRVGSTGREESLSAYVDLITDSKVGFDPDHTDRIDDQADRGSLSPGSSDLEEHEVRLSVVPGAAHRHGAVVVRVSREGQPDEHHVGLGGRDAALLDVVGRLAELLGQGHGRRLVANLPGAALPKLLVQRSRRVRSPLLYSRVLRLAEQARRAGVEIVLRGSSSAAPPTPAVATPRVPKQRKREGLR
jgi:hypothetical protein